MSSKKAMTVVGVVLFVFCSAWGAESAVPGFASKPTVTKEGKLYKIEFAVKNYCDATVAVVAPDGKVVRHLASGVLGENAPAPFTKHSLTQSLAWDGKDDAGRPVPTGSVVRVGLGTRAEFERILRSEPQGMSSRGPVALAVDDQGVMYCVHGHQWVGNITTVITITAFDREGDFVKTIVPFRADWPREKVSAIDWLKLADGREVPLTGPNAHRPYSGFIQGIPGMRRFTALVNSKGQLVMAAGRPFQDREGKTARRLIAIGTDGSAPAESFFGPPMPGGARAGSETFMAFSPDERYIYVTGFRTREGPTQGVWRVRWSDKEAASEPFIGSASESGSDEYHFDSPRGLAVDSDGRIAVGDYLNDRVQVFSSEGKFLKSLKVTGPDTVIINPKTHEVYVLSVRDRGRRKRYADVTWELYGDKSIIKYGSLDDWTEMTRIDLPERERYFHDSPPIIALDNTRARPQLWVSQVGRQEPDDFLWRIEDRGNKLVKLPHKVIRFERTRGVEVDPRLAGDPIHNCFYVLDQGKLSRYDASSGKEEQFSLKLPDELSVSKEKQNQFRVASIRVGPDGLLYVRARTKFGLLYARKRDANWITCRFDQDGNLVPFAVAGVGIRGFGRHGGEKGTDFNIGPDGSLYIAEYAGPQGPYCQVNRYKPDGTLDKAGTIAEMTRTGGQVVVGPRGELYVADAVRPADKMVPDFVGSDPRNHLTKWYGTLCRFDPLKGGSFAAKSGGQDYVAHQRGRVKLVGALWAYYGISPFPTGANCECSIAGIDIDRFGRIWAPDLCTFSIQVLDSAGNLVYRFGSYGNYDAQGPTSVVPKPPIPLWYPREVAVIDNAAIIADVNNRRTIQVKVGFAATEDVTVK